MHRKITSLLTNLTPALSASSTGASSNQTQNAACDNGFDWSNPFFDTSVVSFGLFAGSLMFFLYLALRTQPLLAREKEKLIKKLSFEDERVFHQQLEAIGTKNENKPIMVDRSTQTLSEEEEAKEAKEPNNSLEAPLLDSESIEIEKKSLTKKTRTCVSLARFSLYAASATAALGIACAAVYGFTRPSCNN